MKRYVFIMLFIVISCKDYGQQIINNSTYPEIGMPCPDFCFKEVDNYSKKEVNLHDFRGRWLVLDFWNRLCSSCLASFPKINEFQKKFPDSVEILLVGYTGSQYSNYPDNGIIQNLYGKISRKTNLNLTVAFDSVLFHQFDIGGCPYIVIIDPNGIVRGITYKLEAENIADFIRGRSPLLPRAWRKGENHSSADDKKTESEALVSTGLNF